MRTIGHWIDGRRSGGTGERTSDVHDPVTGVVQAQVALASTADVDATVGAAVEAFRTWSQVASGFAGTPRSWRRAERLVGAGLVRLDPLVSDVLPLADREKAVTRTRAGDGVTFVLEPGS